MTLDLNLSIKPEFTDPDVLKGVEFAKKAHKGQFRESGEPFVTHPLWVANVVSQLGIGKEAVIAALLHDCVEDTPVTLENVANEFGDEVALLVNGLTEVKKKTSGMEVHQTNIEVFRRFLFSSVDDVRVLIIRLVDKLHNGLTIDFLSPERQSKYAERIFGIYSPVAEYVGLHYFKKLLDDIAFKILNPDEAKKWKNILAQREKEEIKASANTKRELIEMLDINNINDYEIQSRIKSLYSTYLRAKRRNGDESLFDRVGIRVITKSVSDCYTVLGLLHAKYQYLPEEFDDYISNPKPSGYRSIQTTLNWREKLTVEVQIRTRAMHEFNEFGPASHIAYKISHEGQEKGMGFEWVKDLVNWQNSDKNIRNYRISVLDKYIYVFTPKGDVIQLPKGSSALDFAYRIHTDIGDRCVGAKINQKMAKIDDELKTGDLIEILINKKINVSKNWLSIVKTNFARDHIRKITGINL